jgi:hypothetical protein
MAKANERLRRKQPKLSPMHEPGRPRTAPSGAPPTAPRARGRSRDRRHRLKRRACAPAADPVPSTGRRVILSGLADAPSLTVGFRPVAGPPLAGRCTARTPFTRAPIPEIRISTSPVSGKPTSTGWSPARMASAFHELMLRLGYPRYVSQGGDWGAIISEVLALQRARLQAHPPDRGARGGAGARSGGLILHDRADYLTSPSGRCDGRSGSAWGRESLFRGSSARAQSLRAPTSRQRR